MVFAVMDHDALVEALKHVWDQIAPPAMFTAAANNAIAKTEDFTEAIDLLKWNIKTTNAQNEGREGYGFTGTEQIIAQRMPGSNGAPTKFDAENGYFVEKFGSASDIYVPAGFNPIRGENIIYADTLPPY
jgi:hypothetical protein